jgi:hypothetical protein
MSTSNNSKKQIEDLRSSAGYVKDYYALGGFKDPKNAPNPTKRELDDYLSIYQKDAIVSGAIDTTGEETVRNKGYFLGSKSAIEKATKLFKKLDFYARTETHVKTQHIYGDSFIELVPGDNGEPVAEMHNLETTEMHIDYNIHGDIISYTQKPFDLTPTGRVKFDKDLFQTWSKKSDNVRFFPLKQLGSQVRSYPPLAPAIRSLISREYGHFFLETTFKNFKPQTIYSTDNNISGPQVEALVAGIRAADKDPSKKILSIGPLDVKNTGMYDFKKDIVDILNYLRQEVLTVTKVPGIYVGITDGSNRGVAEFEANAFQSHLLRLQRDVEKIAEWILEKANIKAEFKMRPPSIKSQTDIIDQAKKLRDMGYGDEVITPFLHDNGIDVPMDAKFEEANTVSMDDQPSRQSGDKGVTEGKFKLDENGRSDTGKDKQADQDSKLRSSNLLSRIFK